jgi:heme-degrading monooxygenase HmoA
MITEIAVLNTREERKFEIAFEEAEKIISKIPGYMGHELQKCLEKDNKYILIVRWATIEHHTHGFRQSVEYATWKRLLHHFYDPFPVVEHFKKVN